MTPEWLDQNAKITTSYKATPEAFEILRTSGGKYQRVIRVPIVPPSILSSKDRYTVTMILAENNTLPLEEDHDLNVGISDMHSYIGFQILDVKNYPKYVPCSSLEGNVGSSTLQSVSIGKDGPMINYTRQSSSEVKMQLRPSENWGSCHTEQDQGYVIIKSYQHSLDPSNGLYFEFYRDNADEFYSIKYIEVDVELD